MAAKQDDNLKRFKEEAADELLFNFVYRKGENTGGTFSYDFKKSGIRAVSPARFIDFEAQELLKDSPKRRGKKDDSLEVEFDLKENAVSVWKKYNCTKLNTSNDETETIAAYREKLLVQARQMITENGDVNSKDDFGNTSLHFVTALPGVSDENPNLIRYLLKAGADPLVRNNDGLNILHILVGRIKAEEVRVKKLKFGKTRVDALENSHWKRVLETLIQIIPKENFVRLMTEPGRDHNTVMHEWVISTETVSLVDEETWQKEIKIASKLIQLGGNLQTSNKFGLVPLHYGFQKSVFKFLIENGAVCRSRNYHDETPLLFILKYFIALPLVQMKHAIEVGEIRRLLDKETEGMCTTKSFNKAIFVAKQLIELLSENKEIRGTVWCADKDDVSPFEVVLICLRFASSQQGAPSRQRMAKEDIKELQNTLLDLLLEILKARNPRKENHLKGSDQNSLHVLFSGELLGVANEDTIIECAEALIQHGVDVNAVDANGRTALHLACMHLQIWRSLMEKCAGVLVSNGARTDLKDSTGKSVEEALQEVEITCCQQVSNVQKKCKVAPYTSPRHHNNIRKLITATSGVKVVRNFRYFENTPIGLGSFGSIYVAIKKELPERSDSKSILCRATALKRIEKARIVPQKIEEEIKTLVLISTACPNIVTYYETIDDNTFYYISLELMEGDLEHFINDKKMMKTVRRNPTITVQAANDLINALAFLHKEKFIHRDLKPGNVMYTLHDLDLPSLSFKIADFGLAKNTSTFPTMTSIKGSGAMAPGTRGWMAPELVSLESKQHSKESDVFALGLVLHYLLTMGKHPFVSPTQEQALHVIEKNIEDMEMFIDKSLSNEAKHFIEAILVKKPNLRPPANKLYRHSFLWSDQKKNKFLIAVGDQFEAANPSKHPKSALEYCLQITDVGIEIGSKSWDTRIPKLYHEMTTAWKKKKYRTNILIDLVRFIRNAYHHKEEYCAEFKAKLENNIFLKEFPSLLFDVFLVLLNKGFLKRSNIHEVVESSE